jgi:hypothetical protein
MGVDYNYTQDFYAAWITVVSHMMDNGVDIFGGAVSLCWSTENHRLPAYYQAAKSIRPLEDVPLY